MIIIIIVVPLQGHITSCVHQLLPYAQLVTAAAATAATTGLPAPIHQPSLPPPAQGVGPLCGTPVPLQPPMRYPGAATAPLCGTLVPLQPPMRYPGAATAPLRGTLVPLQPPMRYPGAAAARVAVHVLGLGHVWVGAGEGVPLTYGSCVSAEAVGLPARGQSGSWVQGFPAR